MVICRECGRFNVGRAGFCTKCGAPLNMKRGERCTIEGGFDAMAEGRFAEAMYRWYVAAKSGQAPNDDQYRRMVESSAECILSQLSDSAYSSREGVSEFSRELSRDMNCDIMERLSLSLSSVTTKTQLSRLAGEYMFLVLDSFGSHPDIRDMVRIMKRANEVMNEFKTSTATMAGSDRNLEKEMEFYVTYTATAFERMNSRIYREGRDRTNQISEYWASMNYLPFAEKAVDAAKQYSKVNLQNKNSGNRVEIANKKMDDFLDSYYVVPIQRNRT